MRFDFKSSLKLIYFYQRITKYDPLAFIPSDDEDEAPVTTPVIETVLLII